MKNFFTSMLLVVVMATTALACTGCQNEHANVTANQDHAAEWVKNTLPGYELTGFTSATLDNDGDGYVSVDITVAKPESDTFRLMQLQCPTAGQMLKIQKGDGCKFSQMAFTPDFSK